MPYISVNRKFIYVLFTLHRLCDGRYKLRNYINLCVDSFFSFFKRTIRVIRFTPQLEQSCWISYNVSSPYAPSRRENALQNKIYCCLLLVTNTIYFDQLRTRSANLMSLMLIINMLHVDVLLY